jgi:hypothetical protein
MRRLRGVAIAAALSALVVTAGASSRSFETAPQSLTPPAGASFTAGTHIVFTIRADQLSGTGYLWLHVSPSPVVRNACGTIGSETEIEAFGPTADPTVFEAKPTFFDYPGFWMNTPGTYYWQAYRISYQGGADGCLESEVRAFTIVPKATPPPSPSPPAPKPPRALSAARLQGTFEVVTRITSVKGIDVETGDKETFDWTFRPACRSGACSVRLSFPYRGAFDRHTLSLRLARSGAVYKGSATAKFLECNYRDVPGPVTITVRVTKGAWVGGVWRATRIRGSYVHTTRAATSGIYTCPAARVTATLTGSLGG